MSSKIKGLRRVGIVGLSTVVAASMMTFSAANSFAATGDYKALSQETVAQGQLGAPAGNLTFEFLNNWNTGASQTFTVKANGATDCTTAAGIAQAAQFSALPTATVSDPAPVNAAADVPPAFTLALTGSSAACITAGVKDVLTLTQSAPATGTITDNYLLTLSNVKYNVGTTAPTGNISVGILPGNPGFGVGNPTSVSNATIPAVSITSQPKTAALFGATASLGAQTITEGSAGAVFTANADTAITLILSAGTFTAGITPTITLPAGYALVPATPVPPTTAGPNYTFTVHAPVVAVKATVTVSGLTMTVPGTTQTVTLDVAKGAPPAAVSLGTVVPVVNVLDFSARIGGASRYETSAALFTSTFQGVGTTSVVLSGGQLFPDALSANYLAGNLGTGTLLTAPTALSSAVFSAIVGSPIATVYITGGFGAVSKAVQTRIEATHISNNPNLALITVVRLGGIDRFATNRIVNAFNFTSRNTVLLAGGLNFPDSLSVGPVAYANHYPLIITRGTTLGASEKAQLNDFNPTNVVIVGGIGVVSPGIEASLKAQGLNVIRLAGQERTLTAAAVATWASVGVDGAASTGISVKQGFVNDGVYITTGQLFPDALSAGPVAGKFHAVIMPASNSTTVGAGITSYFGSKTVGLTADGTKVGRLIALGLTGATSNALMKAAAATIG